MYQRSKRSGNYRFSQRPKFNGNGGKRNIKTFSDISKFIHRARDVGQNEIYQPKTNFENLAIDESLKANISKKGYTLPTPIQDETITHILAGKDLLGIANTGTGKTGAFLIPLLNKVLQNPSEQVLIMAPTRELALQIQHEFFSLSSQTGISSVLCIGGTSMYQQKDNLSRKYNFVIGTPGRLKDLINQRALHISSFGSVVLDEVDRMLDMGFIHDIKTILSSLPSQRQTLFFSATASGEILELIHGFSKDLVTVSVKYTDTAETIDQDIVKFKGSENKLEVLNNLLRQDGFNKVLIFGRTKHGVRKLSEKLNYSGFRTDSIHGNKSQPQRERALRSFRQNRVNILVATDVAARGLDIDGVTHVINYDLPESYENYIHRIGRTGRANHQGKALTFVE
ncbi:DEAD/DEAH box helicase [Candidatus Beckwithbacteria bacterium]|nr:DEAD/DEAH box helicase [Candidatus Beckwithbacteria bacterium]